MADEATVQALTEELEFTEDKVIQLTEKVKKLKKEINEQREFYETKLREFRKGGLSAGTYKVDYQMYQYAVDAQAFAQQGNITATQVQPEPVGFFDEPGDPVPLPDETVTNRTEWAANPWGTTTFVAPTGTITNVDTNTGIVNLAMGAGERQPMTAADRIEWITDLMQRGIINDAGARDLMNGLTARDIITGEIIAP